MKASGNKLQGFTILAEISQKSAICKKCKAASCSLTLLEKPNSTRGLGEQFILRCTACNFENHSTVQAERFHQ